MRANHDAGAEAEAESESTREGGHAEGGVLPPEAGPPASRANKAREVIERFAGSAAEILGLATGVIVVLNSLGVPSALAVVYGVVLGGLVAGARSGQAAREARFRQQQDQVRVDEVESTLKQSGVSDTAVKQALDELSAGFGEDDLAADLRRSGQAATGLGWAVILLGAGALTAAYVLSRDGLAEIASLSEVSVGAALARIAVALPFLYGTGVLVKLGSAEISHGRALRNKAIAIKTIPELAKRLKNEDRRETFIVKAFLAQLDAAPADRSEEDPDESLFSMLKGLR